MILGDPVGQGRRTLYLPFNNQNYILEKNRASEADISGFKFSTSYGGTPANTQALGDSVSSSVIWG